MKLSKRSRSDIIIGLVASTGGAIAGLLYSEPFIWYVGSTVVILPIGVAKGVLLKGPAKLIGFLLASFAAGAILTQLGHSGLAQGGLLTAMGGVLIGTALLRTKK